MLPSKSIVEYMDSSNVKEFGLRCAPRVSTRWVHAVANPESKEASNVGATPYQNSILKVGELA